MKYVNLHIFFFVVHLCNTQMSAASTRHRLKVVNYDIDRFVSQLFASRRFVELVDKLSEEAANRIQYIYDKKLFIVSSDIGEDPVYKLKGTKHRSKGKTYDIDGFISQVLASKKIHKLLAKLTVNAASKIMSTDANSEFRTRTESSHEHQPKPNQVVNKKMREESTGKVDMQAIIDEMLSLSKNLKLKSDYDESDTDIMESKQSETTGSVNKDHISTTVGRPSKHNVTENNKSDSKKKTIDENKRSRDDADGNYGKENPNRYSETSHSGHSGTVNQDQEQGPSQEHLHSREAQKSEHKGVKQKTSQMDKKNRGEESLLGLDEENQNPSLSEEKTKREVEETKEETENRSTDEKIEDKNVGVQDHEDSVKNNKMVSDDNPYGEIYNNKSSEDSGDRRSQEQPQERSLEDQRSKEQSDEGQVKPVIRKEGGKLYTYVQDADYDEYNEQIAEWRKTHPENPADFL